MRLISTFCLLTSGPERPQVEDVLGGAAGADRLHLAEADEVLEAFVDLDVEAAGRGVGRQQHRRDLAEALSAEGRPARCAWCSDADSLIPPAGSGAQ